MSMTSSQQDVYSTEQNFKPITESSALDLKPPVDIEAMTFRLPEQSFDGQDMSGYFKMRSEPLRESSGSMESESVKFHDTLSISQVTILKELTATDSTLALTKKLLLKNMQKKKKKATQRETYEAFVPFIPSANSTEIISEDQETLGPVVTSQLSKLRLPLFVPYRITASAVRNDSPTSYNLVCLDGFLGENFKVVTSKPVVVPPFSDRPVDTGIDIIPMKIGRFVEQVELHFESRGSKSVMHSCKLVSGLEVEHVKIEWKHPSIKNNVHFFLFDEAHHFIDFEIKNKKFDVNVPLEFRLLGDHNIEFMTYAKSKQLSASITPYRCPELNVLKLTSNSGRLIRIPLWFKSHSAVCHETLTVCLDTDLKDILESYSLSVHFWEKKVLTARCLKSNYKTIKLSLGKAEKILLRNSSENEAIVVNVDAKSSNCLLQFSMSKFLLPPQAEVPFHITLVSSTHKFICIDLTYHAGVKTVTDVVQILAVC